MTANLVSLQLIGPAVDVTLSLNPSKLSIQSYFRTKGGSVIKKLGSMSNSEEPKKTSSRLKCTNAEVEKTRN